MAKAILIRDRFYWNVEQHVGVGGANKTDDVHLVQLGYFCMALVKAPEVPAEMIAVAAKIKPGDSYGGGPNEDLSVAIKLHQKLRGGVQDGVISPATGNAGQYAPHLFWMIISLDHNIADQLGNNWPHLDKHPRCTAALASVAKTTFEILGKK